MKKRTAVLLASAALAAAALAGCSNKNQTQTSAAAEDSTETSTEESTQEATEAAAEEQEINLVIAGGDGAGLAAAIQAVADGVNPSSILIVESGKELAADVTEKESFVNAANTAEQFDQEIEDDYEIYLADTLKAGNNLNNPEMAEFLAEDAEGAKDWLENLGIKFGDLKKENGSSVARSFYAEGGELNTLTKDALVKKVEELKIPVELGAELKAVSYNDEGAVAGVVIEADGKENEVNTTALVVTDQALLALFEDAQVYKDAEGKAAGLLVNSVAEVLGSDEESIPGLYAAGGIIEAGIHGAQALAGNEMTAMIVFGSTAGTESAIYISDNK